MHNQSINDSYFSKEANYDFYQDVNKMLSIKPIYFEFPIFRGNISATDVRAGSLYDALNDDETFLACF
jgi:hypothetical protein